MHPVPSAEKVTGTRAAACAFSRMPASHVHPRRRQVHVDPTKRQLGSTGRGCLTSINGLHITPRRPDPQTRRCSPLDSATGDR